MKELFIDFNNLNKKDQGKITKGSVIPRPVAWITSFNSEGVINLAPFSYFNALSSSLVAISFQRKGLLKKDTANNILYSKEAVINIPSIELLADLDISSKEIDSNLSELTLTNLTLVDSKKIKVPGIKEVKIRLETKLVEHIKLFDYTNTTVEADLLIMRIVGASFNEEVYDQNNNYVLFDKLNPISRLGGPYYGSTKVIKDFTRKF